MKLNIAFTMVVQPFTRPAAPSQDCCWEEDREELPQPQEVENFRLDAELFEVLGVQGPDYFTVNRVKGERFRCYFLLAIWQPE